MEKKLKTKVIGTYGGHGIKTNESVDVTFKCPYDQLVNYIQLIQYLNADTLIVAKIPDNEPLELGTFRVKEVKVDHDGEGVIRFNSMNDFVDTDALNKLVGTERLQLMFSAIVDIEEEE